ncbi:MAG: hypothetical protein ACFCAD_21305 [Pleurocapsa sp.]
MKVSMKPKLVSLLTFIFCTVVFTTDVFLSKYVFQSVAATVNRLDFSSMDNSVPLFPKNLALNETQEYSIIKINQEISQEIQRILPPEQLQQFTSRLANGIALHFALSNLSLADKQKNKLWVILDSAQSQIEQVLTPEQLEYIRQQ